MGNSYADRAEPIGEKITVDDPTSDGRRDNDPEYFHASSPLLG